MIKPILNDKKVIIGPCRLAYVHLFERFNPDNAPDGGKYCAMVLIPKEEAETLEAVRTAIERAKADGLAKKWNGRLPSKFNMPMFDGADKGFDGFWAINAKSKDKPGVVGRDKMPITDPEQVYSGMWALVSMTFYPYSTGGGNGVGAALENVLKSADGERLNGKASAAADFADIALPADDGSLAIGAIGDDDL